MSEKKEQQIPLAKKANKETGKDPVTARFIKPLAGHGLKPVPPQTPREEDFSAINNSDANWADALKDEMDEAESPEIAGTETAAKTTIIKKDPSKPPVNDETSVFVEEEPGLKEAVLAELRKREVGKIVAEEAPTRKLIDANFDPVEGTRRALEEIEKKYREDK